MAETKRTSSTNRKKARATKSRAPKLPSTLAKMTPEERTAALHVLASTIAMRASIEQRMGKQYGDEREIFEALGYKTQISFNDYMALYYRQDIAGTVVDLPVDESWRLPPEITESEEEETEFEKAWKKLAKERRVFHYLNRVDTLASLGDYAVLFLGFDDSGKLDDEVTSARRLLYMMPYSRANAAIDKSEADTKNERYGRPLIYKITREMVTGTTGTDTIATSQMNVHWQRVIHVAEKCLENDVKGTPRLQRIYNRCDDMLKLAGGSAEMFWRGAFPGYAFKFDQGATLGVQSMDDLESEIEAWMHGLTRYLRLRGVSVDELAMQVADPRGHMDVQLDLISAASRIPKRILLGSERGELSSLEDKVNWAAHIEARQQRHCEPVILRPFIDRNIEVGVLPEPKTGEYACEWPDTLAPGIKEKAEIGKTRSEAIRNFVNAIGADEYVPRKTFYEKVLMLSPDEVDEVDALIEEMQREEAMQIREEGRQHHPEPPVEQPEIEPVEV